MSGNVPSAIREDMRKARRLEYWTLFWIGSIVVVMFLTMGSSQAMKSAWTEDLLSLVPAIVFLVAAHFETRAPTDKFRYGFHRVNSLAFLVAAVALLMVGGFLLFEAVTTLVTGEHPTIGPITLFGHRLWLGWVMIAALVYSVVPPVILGRMKQPVAHALQDKVLYTDALMQKADWMTGLAGVAGILGVGAGLWWADAAAAGFISFEILRDGVKNVRTASAELIDGMPRALGSNDIADDANELERALHDMVPGAAVRMRESGRYICVELETGDAHVGPRIGEVPAPKRAWRLDTVSVVKPRQRGG